MVDIIPQIEELVLKHPSAPETMKNDGTPVTSLDLALSVLIENMTIEYYPEVIFYSEENYSSWSFPLMAVDPLDGTREYIKKRPEWSVSIAYLENEKLSGEGWIYNPSTKEIFESSKIVSFRKKQKYSGEVSRSEWDKGHYQDIKSEKFEFKAVGSIAYKLGRLSAGKSDFVVSLAPKNIWDVAAGTLLCQLAGLKFYSEGEEVREVRKLYKPPLIWCHEEIFSELSGLFPSKDKAL